MLIDTHAHLFFKNFESDLDKVIADAREAGVGKIVIPATDIASAKQLIGICERYEHTYGTVGIHPHDCKNWDEKMKKELAELAMHPKIIGIGEIGLDYFYDFTPKEIQKKAFIEQLNLALELDLPVVIHNRDSDADMLHIIRKYEKTTLRAQFHCFNANLEFAETVLALGHYISFTGNITFRKADELRSIVAAIPLNRIMLETDSPFMTPIPHRGQRNEPKYLTLVAQQLAETKGIGLPEIEKQTTENALIFFNLKEKGKLTFTYKLGDALYINVTNRCNADCVFCARKDQPVLHGYSLGMEKSAEPDAGVYINEIGDPTRYSEIVFCGYGEPTIRLDIIKEVGKYVKQNGGNTRLNTNGHGNIINKRDITPELQGVLDCVSISLNSHDRKQYAELMRLPESYYDAMLEFAGKAMAYIPEVVLSVVNYPGVDLEASEKVAHETGVQFRVRAYF
ncbi:MAG: YchF/TatD family DNA exonuclease [Ignavibacteria bacterium]|nr:YchF/TatD family DNA exonuclease [Ignavibacteria bacterium]